ncbi:MAG: hypothetical protein C0601_08075 [Candidatus Muiribacterium halophilum]|uniref:Guanylate cyclase domain-containing protein n=1 Tax=Muiribacterium halophilum TaxID=2053465 RepID=A0A2N5ZF31_MUIH1|nr:MAG: hypothetical protein C0601_08075 [Candidatus Muirbacterium halophilum]
MKFFENPEVREENLLICFSDLTNFVKIAKKMTDLELYDFLQEFYSFYHKAVEEKGGFVVKFMGDSALVVFPEDKVDEGVLLLKVLKTKVDDWIRSKGENGRLIVKVHFGKVVCGFSGTKNNKKFDVFGDEVNKAAMLQSKGFATSVELFRKLKKETRTHFKKHTPPITYIPVEHQHR